MPAPSGQRSCAGVDEAQEPGGAAVAAIDVARLLEQRSGRVELPALVGDAAGEPVDVGVVEDRARRFDVLPGRLEIAEAVMVPGAPVACVADDPAAVLDDARQRRDRLARLFEIGEADALPEPRLVVPRLPARDALVQRQRFLGTGDPGHAGEVVGDRQRARDGRVDRAQAIAGFAPRRRLPDERQAVAPEPVVGLDVAGLSDGKRTQGLLVRPPAGRQPPLHDRVRHPRLGDGGRIRRVGSRLGRAGQAHVQVDVERVSHRRRPRQPAIDVGRGRRRAEGVPFPRRPAAGRRRPME